MTHLTRRAALGLFTAAPVLALGTPALARDPDVFQKNGVALGGTDVVAYFTEAAPVAGKAAHSVDWNGATWRFASQANADAFASDPVRYAPVFGGYCAWAASRGYVAPTVPEAWTIHGGKLYLNASLRIRRRWERDIEGNIAKGLANWPGILS